MKKVFIKLLLIFQLFGLSTFAQVPKMKFKHLTADGGLSSNRITCIYRDSNDFLWVGTEMGLNKYDGYQVIQYLQDDRKKGSLSDNNVQSIVEDVHKNLWVATKKGLNLYNRATDSFSTFKNKPSDSNSISSDYIISLYSDKKGHLWILAGGNCLNLWVPEKRQFIRYRFKSLVERSYFSAQGIAEDSKGNIWTTCYGDSLFCLNPKTHRFSAYNLELKASEKTLNNLYIDKYDKIWIGTRGAGLHVFDPLTKKTEHFPIKADGSGTNKSLIHWIIADDDQHLLLAVDLGGLNRLNVKTRRFEYIQYNEYDQEGLNTDGIWALYKDKEGILWVGTANGGVNYYNPKEYKFDLYRAGNTNASPSSNVVGSFLEDSDGKIWIATENGMNGFNPVTKKFSHFRHNPNDAGSLSGNVVRCLEEDLQGNIWVGTWDAGLNRFDKKTNTFERFNSGSKSTPFNLSGRHVWHIKRDYKGALWMAMTYVGIDVLDPKKGVIKRFKKDLKNKYALGADIVYLLVEDKQKNMWACTVNGLYRYDEAHNGFIAYKNFPDNDIRSFLQDSKGNFWAGSANKGLFLFDRQGRVLMRFDVNNGLANNQVHAIVEDDNGTLWISTNLGLSQLDPKKGTIRNFFVGDGLQGNQFFMQSSLKTRSGEIYFGGYGGFNVFNPKQLKHNEFKAPVYISDFQVFNKSIIPGAPDALLKQQISQTRDITLSWTQSMFSFSFAAINYTFSAKTEYAYKLQGFDKDWNYIGNKRSATFTNLDPGEYVFQVKAANNDGIWNERTANIRITILPPWYQTWWAYLLYMGALATILYSYIRYRTKQARLEYEIETANFKVEKEKELHRKKVDFFTSISHEFRSPLTLIINPLKEMLYDEGKELSSNKLIVVYRNARRLLSLVDQLLLFRKSETELEKLKIAKLSITDVCKEIYLCFTNQAKQQEIELVFEPAEENLEVYADREKIEIVIFNLLSNALKFTPAQGKVQVRLSETESLINIEVADTGLGIPSDVGGKLFEQFYQVAHRGTTAKGGFGIGLYLVKNFIEAHHGTIAYTSKEGEGTAFALTLKKGKEHFGSQIIVEEPTEASYFLEGLVVEENDEMNDPEELMDGEKNKPLYSEIKTILVIDDNADLRRYIKQLFDDEFEVLDADNGSSGLEMINKHMPDIVISDVMMQGLSGIELCSRIKDDASLRHIPIILLTASSSAEIKLKGIECGADDFISKPFEKEILMARVSGILKSRNNLQNYFYNKITLQPDNSKISPEHKEFLDKCIQIIEENLRDEDFGIKKLATEIGMSHSALYKRIKSIFGQSGISFLRSIRLRKAAEIFVTTDLTINEVAFMVGMKDIKHFREHFNNLFGMNPSEYIKKYRNQFHKNQSIKKQIV